MVTCDILLWDPEGGTQKATLVVVVVLVVGISSPGSKIPKAFLIAYTFVLTLPTDLPPQIWECMQQLQQLAKVCPLISSACIQWPAVTTVVQVLPFVLVLKE